MHQYYYNRTPAPMSGTTTSLTFSADDIGGTLTIYAKDGKVLCNVENTSGRPTFGTNTVTKVSGANVTMLASLEWCDFWEGDYWGPEEGEVGQVAEDEWTLRDGLVRVSCFTRLGNSGID